MCPGKKDVKALIMKPLASQMPQMDNWNYALKNVTYKSDLTGTNNVKNSQFAKPLFEFSGACAGCGETPYIKLITQLFGDRMMVANATGCSSIYGGKLPLDPVHHQRPGPRPGVGEQPVRGQRRVRPGHGHRREQAPRPPRKDHEGSPRGRRTPRPVSDAFTEWLANKMNGAKTREVSKKVEEVLKGRTEAWAKTILELKQYLVKTSQWIFGGDGWAYDIGFGGLDHVLGTGETSTCS